LFYYIPAALVLAATSKLVPLELWQPSQLDIYVYGFGMVIIIYSLIGAAIAFPIRGIIRLVRKEQSR